MTIGPEEDKGIADYPVWEGGEYPRFVSAVDVDGNEIAGVKMPDISVPLGTHTGWNPRDPSTGAPDQIISMVGFTNYFPSTDKFARPNQDFRKSNSERYSSREEYLELISQAAEKLVQQKYLLKEDIPVVLERCGHQYDEAILKGNHI